MGKISSIIKCYQGKNIEKIKMSPKGITCIHTCVNTQTCTYARTHTNKHTSWIVSLCKTLTLPSSNWYKIDQMVTNWYPMNKMQLKWSKSHIFSTIFNHVCPFVFQGCDWLPITWYSSPEPTVVHQETFAADAMLQRSDTLFGKRKNCEL